MSPKRASAPGGRGGRRREPRWGVRSARFHGDGHDIRRGHEMFCDNASRARHAREVGELRRQRPPVRPRGRALVGSVQEGKPTSHQLGLMGRRSRSAASSRQRRALLCAGGGTWVLRVLWRCRADPPRRCPSPWHRAGNEEPCAGRVIAAICPGQG